MIYIVGLLAAFCIALLLVPVVKKVAFRVGAVDAPKPGTRKIHTKTMARGGGVAIYIAFTAVCLVLLGDVGKNFWGLFVAGTMVLIIGFIDDVHSLPPWVKLVGQVVAALVAILGFGIQIDSVTNPFGVNIVFEGSWHFTLFGIQATVNPFATLLTLFWLVGMTNTINFVDGLDGLSGGIAAIAAIIMFFISIGPDVSQPQTALIAIILAGGCLGYLVYNFHPAKIFNGDSGAYFLGMTLAILAIYSGAKLATAALVLGVPIVDALWSVMRRLAAGRSPFSADRGHLHFLLLDVGFTQRQAVLFIYSLCAFFGIIAIVASPAQKVIAIFALVIVIMLLLLGLTLLRRKKSVQ